MSTERLSPLDAWVEESGAQTKRINTPCDGPRSHDEGTSSPLGGVHLMVPRLPPPERCGFSVDDRGIDDGAEHDKVLEPWIPTSSDKWTMPTEERLPDDGETDTGGTTSSNHRHRSQGDSSIGSCSRISGTSPGDHDAQGQSSANFTPSGSHAHLHNQHLFSSQRPRTPSSSYSRAPPERSSGECLNSPSSCAEGGHRNDAPSPRLGVSPARFKNSGLGSPVVSSPRSESPGTRGGGGNDGIVFSPRKLGRRSSDSQMQARRNGDSLGGVSHNFKVVIRVRPPLPREVDGERMFQNIVSVDKDEHVITISENLDAVLAEDGSVVGAGGPYSTHAFTFDHVYDVSSSQQKVYNTTAREVVDSSLRGYNATVFAYGQTGTGKTFTMEGFKRGASSEDRGIIPRAIEQVFAHIQRNAFPRMRFLVRASYLQIYNEQISDLLKPERSNLAIREDRKRGVFVEGLSEWVVRTPGEIYGLMERGGQLRATGATRMNDTSSRSHAVFIIIVEQSETCYADERGKEISPEEVRQLLRRAEPQERDALVRRLDKDARQTFKVGKLNLVDLAGSERVRLSGATGQRLQESKKINQSLSALGNVIAALTDHRGRQHIPYRDSKLTRLLEDSLGGNCKTTMMAMISPALESMVETLSTVKFASRAKSIKNQPVVNEDLDQKSLLRKYERELKRLRAELEERSRNLVDKRQLLYVEGERRRAEADKMAAIRALEERSLEFQREKEEKRLLEGRIAMLTGQMIGRGRRADAGGDGAKYADRLADLERERNTIEMEKEQVERYKQLLMKQRDIMIALTQRLNERDDAICELNDELDANEAHQELLEDALDMRTQQLFRLQKTLVLHSGGEEGGREGDGNHLLSQTLEGNLGPVMTSAQSPQSTPRRPSTAPAHGTVPAVCTSLKAKKEEHSRDLSTNSLAASRLGKNVAVDDDQNPAGERHVPSPSQDELLTFPRFEPHPLVQPTLFSTDNTAGGVALNSEGVFTGGKEGIHEGGEGDQDVASKGARLLNAWEKIDELEGLVQSSRADNKRLLEDLEEVQTDKVSMEFLLREKLERLVQSEIEARVARMHEDGGVDEILRRQVDGLRVEAAARARSEASLREEIKHLKCSRGTSPDGRELNELRTVNAKLRKRIAECMAGSGVGRDSIPGDSTPHEEGEAVQGGTKRRNVDWSNALNDRCEALRGERKAMQKIMEQKVQVLVDNVTDSARTVLNLIPVDKKRASVAGSVVFNGERGVGGIEVTETAATAEDGDNNSATSRATRDASSALNKDLGQLRRLVQAAIGALRIAEKEDDERTQEIAAAHRATTTVSVRESRAGTSTGDRDKTDGKVIVTGSRDRDKTDGKAIVTGSRDRDKTDGKAIVTGSRDRDKTDGKAIVTGSRDQLISGEWTREDSQEQTLTDTVDEGSTVLLCPRDGEYDVQSFPSCSIRPEAGIGSGAVVGTVMSSGLTVAAGNKDSFSRIETSNDGIGDGMASPCQERISPGEDAYSTVIGEEDFARGGRSVKHRDLCRVAVEVGDERGIAHRGGSCESEDGGGENESKV